jgi:phenylacetate-CoA ligase
MIVVNMGLSELSLSIFSENFYTLQIRRAAQKDSAFREALYGQGRDICPPVMQYFPQQTFLETIPDQSGRPVLLVSLLDKRLKIPLIRYQTGDEVKLLGHHEVKTILKRHGKESLIPEFNLPFGFIWGKRLSLELDGGESISPNQVKEALYLDFNIAGRVTGNFRLSKEGRHARLLVQLRPEAESFRDMANILSQNLKDYTQVETEIRFLPYKAFPYGMDHDFERKNQYI